MTKFWRTCRLLVNPGRCVILRAVYGALRGLTVNEVVGVTGLRQPAASIYLRELAHCGLVTPIREGRSVRYVSTANSAVYGAQQIRVALLAERIQAVAQERAGVWFRFQFGEVPFLLGDEKRIAILKHLLSGGGSTLEEILLAMGCPRKTLLFHLGILMEHGLLQKRNRYRKDRYIVMPPTRKLQRMLVSLALGTYEDW
ncbi:MAG: helix-turn-helix domain-containing protein [bacterium]|nr:helix-turn-helix domain-containing protein [bacterium]